MNRRALLLSILAAGAVTGILGNLPLLSLLNCVLCVFAWLGGALSVFFYRRFQPGQASLTAGQGAGLGALSGLVGAFVGAVVFILTAPLSVPLFSSLAKALQVEGDLPFRSGSLWDYASTALFFLVIDAALYPLFGALGGLITANLTRERLTKQTI